jgi:error-prone DNA polymerase
MIETIRDDSYFCNNCAHDWQERTASAGRFQSIDDLVARTGLRRDELTTLADIGALNAFGYDRRGALWQIERAVRPAGALFDDADAAASRVLNPDVSPPPAMSPLPVMTATERLLADYAGTSLTIGPHPMAMRRAELATRGVLRAIDLPRARHGRRVRVAGTVITRQRPGTAKGFVFLTLEDETGIANVIITPDLFDRERMRVIGEPFLLVEGMLQNQDGVTSVKAERLEGIAGVPIDFESHDFH